MGNSVDMGQIALLGLQLVVLIVGAVIYSLQHGMYGLEKRDRGMFGDRVAEALRQASAALRGAEMIEVEHYKALATKYAALLTEVEQLRVQIHSCNESVSSLSNKLASRQRADAAADRRAMERETAAVKRPLDSQEIPSGVDPLEWMKANGLAAPLAYQQTEMPLAQPKQPSGFGRKVA